MDKDLEFCDQHFSFIAGYTSSGLPYGVTWEEAREISRALGEDSPSPDTPGGSADDPDDPFGDTDDRIWQP
jgi:hypothetical protein